MSKVSEESTRAIDLVREGDLEGIKALLAENSDLLHSAKDWSGDGLLSNACWSMHADIVNFLLDAGAHINVTNNSGATPLHRSCYKCDLGIAEILCNRGADYNIRDRVSKLSYFNVQIKLIAAIF
jgi:ankyrin repeat protein